MAHLAVLSGVLKVKFTIVIVYWGGKRWEEERKDGKEGEKNIVAIAMVRVS